MSDLRLHVHHGEIVEKLPGRCLFCGKRVLDFKLRVVQAGSQQYYLQLPLCDKDRKEGKLYIDNPHQAMDNVAYRSPIILLLWNLFKLFRWARKPKQIRNAQHLVIRGVCPDFLDDFKDMKQEAAETEDGVSEEEVAAKRKEDKAKSFNALFWILGAGGVAAVLFLCCGGLTVFGVMQRRARQSNQNMTKRPVEPIQPPANGGGVVPPPPAPILVRQPPQNEGPKGAPAEILPAFAGHVGNVVGLTYTRNGNALISAGEDGTLRWWQIVEGQAPQQTKQQVAKDKLYGLALSPDGELVAATAWYGNVAMLNGTGGGLPETLETRTGKVAFGLAFSSDNKTLLTGHHAQVIKVWDVPTRKLRTTLKGGNDWTMAIAFSPDGKLFATPGGHDVITLWDAAKQQAIGTLNGHKTGGRGSVRWLSFAPDSKTLASAADDGTARLWDVAEQRERAVMTHPDKQVIGALFTPDGTLLVTGCQDGQIRIWDTATGRQKGGTNLPAPPFAPSITAIAISPDGKSLATGNGRVIRRWNLPSLLQ